MTDSRFWLGSGPRFFFLPTRVGKGGSHFFCRPRKDVQKCSAECDRADEASTEMGRKGCVSVPVDEPCALSTGSSAPSLASVGQ